MWNRRREHRHIRAQRVKPVAPPSRRSLPMLRNAPQESQLRLSYTPSCEMALAIAFAQLTGSVAQPISSQRDSSPPNYTNGNCGHAYSVASYAVWTCADNLG